MSGPEDTVEADGARTAEIERFDVLAYLTRRKANCDLVAKRIPEFADDAALQRRQIDILIDEIRGGLHENEGAGADLRDAPTEVLEKAP